MSDSKPASNRLPLRVGRIESITDIEKLQFRKIGWEPGQPAPVNLAEAIELLRLEAEREAVLRPPVAPDTPPAVPKQIVDIDDLPAEHQARLRDALRYAVELEDRLDRVPVIPQAAPGLREALELSARVEVDGVEDVDDTAPPVSNGETSGLNTARAAICPQCHFNQDNTDVIDVSEDDKYAYLQSLLSGSPFRRRVPIFGGVVSLILRSLTTDEATAVDAQMMDDLKHDRVDTQIEFHTARLYYRTALGVERIDFGADKAAVTPKLSSIAIQPGPDGITPVTGLPQLLRRFESDVVPQESLRRSVGRAYMKFQRLVERLEANSETPDFWQGIASQD